MHRLIPHLMVHVFATLITVLAVAIRHALTPWLGLNLPLITLFPAIAVVALLWGLRPALIPAVAGFLICNHLFRIHTGEFAVESPAGLIVLLTYMVSVIPIVWCGEALRRVRHRLSEHRERLRLTLSSIGDAVVTTDAAGRIDSMNATAIALTGWSGDEALGQAVASVMPLVDEKDRTSLSNPADRAIRERAKATLSDRTLLIRRDGREIEVELSGDPIHSPDGAVLGAILVFRDVGQLRAAERELRDDRARHRLLAEIATMTQRLSDPDEIMAATARLLAEHLRVDRCAYAEIEDEATFVITGDHTRGVPSIVGRWPVAAFGQEVENLMAENLPFVVDDIEADGRAGPDLAAYRATQIRAVICVPLHKDGRFTAAMAVHQKEPRHWRPHEVDLVTTVVARCWESLERSRANRALLDSADRLQLALDASRLGDWSWDIASDQVLFSRRAEEIFGFQPGQAGTWAEVRERIHEDDRTRVLSEIERVVTTRAEYDIEYRLVVPDGGEVWVAAKGRAYYDLEGDPEGMYGVVMDVTDRKQLEQELRRQAGELSEADRRKDDFIAMLAHELRNPLAPIRTGLELLSLPGLEESQSNTARAMMERQLDHLVRLVDDLLDVSRLSRDKLTLRIETVPLAEALRQAVEATRAAREQQGHRLALELPGEDVVVPGDPTRLVQIFGNLISNSIKFTPPGGLISVGARIGEGQVEVDVGDNGIGIAAADLGRVFRMFEQVGPAGAVSGGGLGIGLGLVQALVRMHGGVVAAKSAGPGHGSTFTVTLPLTRTERQPPQDPFRERSASALAGMTVLVVDDNFAASSSLAALISARGGIASTACDGESAKASAASKRPQLILMDVGLPDINGYEVTRWIRRQSWGRSIRIFALTGWGRDEDRALSLEAGCDGHLVKPVKFADIEALCQPGASVPA